MTTLPAAAPLDLDQPVPYSLTLLGYLALGSGRGPVEATPPDDEPSPGDPEWFCWCCGAAYFGPCPDDGMCESCRMGEPEPVCAACGRGDCECWKLDSTGPAITREIPAYEWEW